MLKIQKTKKIYREEHIAVLDVSSDEQDNSSNRVYRKRNQKRRLLERRGYLPIIEPDSSFEVDSVVTLQAPKVKA
jgi:hypothetical protein